MLLDPLHSALRLLLHQLLQLLLRLLLAYDPILHLLLQLPLLLFLPLLANLLDLLFFISKYIALGLQQVANRSEVHDLL